MKKLTGIIHEAHRRSLWQVVTIYIGASWAVVEFVDSVASVTGLPSWAPRMALLLLIVGLPIVIATAFVQDKSPHPDATPSEATPADEPHTGISYIFTWRRAILGGVAAFALLTVGATVWYYGGHHNRAMRIAVLPFENEGASDDAYFASGVADEIRTKLAGIPGLQVTARASTNQYAKTDKPPRQIGQELEVDYLLTATIQWAKSGGSNRVRVHPELIKVADEATLWSESIEKELSDVFAVQTDIAAKVANELDLALGSRTKKKIEERPTKNLDAWDAYLRAEDITQSLGVVDLPTWRKAEPYYLRATELDSAFADAWSRIAQIETEFDRVNPTPEGVARAKNAAQRALALAPNRAAGHLAMAEYLRTAEADYGAALEQLRAGLKDEPKNVELLDALAKSERTVGNFDSALVHLQESRELNPRSVATRRQLAMVYQDNRQFDKALEIAQGTVELSPKNLALTQFISNQWVLMGQLDSARAAVKAALARGVDTTQIIANYALFQEQMWLLPQELLPRLTVLTPAAFDGNYGHWGLKIGGTWKLLGDTRKARMYADSAVAYFENQLKNFPDKAELHELHGRALALAGRTDEAVQEADLSLKLRETKLDALTGPYVRFQVARILVQAGQYDRAIDLLEDILNSPGGLISTAYLRLDPTFQPLHGNPRFEKLTGVKV